MAITEGSRYRMHQRLEELMGDEDAGTLMEHLPPVGWADVATKDDLAHLQAATRTDFNHLRAEVKADIDQFRGEVKAEIDQFRGEVKAEIDQLRGEVKADIAQLRGEVKADINHLRAEVKADIGQLRGEMQAESGLVRSEFAHLQEVMAIQFGTMATKSEVESVRSELHKVVRTHTVFLVGTNLTMAGLLAALFAR